MRKRFNFSKTDSQYEDEIKSMVDEILIHAVKFYQRYNLEVKGVEFTSGFEFDSQGSTFQDAFINFDIESNGYYPQLKFSISTAFEGRKVPPPRERGITIAFLFKGASKEFLNANNVPPPPFFRSPYKKNSKLSDRIVDLMKQSEEKIAVWDNFGAAADIFLF